MPSATSAAKEVLQTSWTTPYGHRSKDHATVAEAADHRRDLVSWGYVLSTSMGGYHHYTKAESAAQVAARSQAHTRPAVDQAGLADTPLFGTASLL